MKKFSALFLMFAVAVAAVMTSCDNGTTDEPIDAPEVTVPSGSSQVGNSVSLTFTVTADGGYASATATAGGGTATISSEPAAGATSGDIVVDFAATSVGSGFVQISVTDNEGEVTASATVSVTVSAEPVKPEIDVFASADGTGTTTWSADNIYVLRGFVFVNDGQTLTIEPGTVIKGQPGTGAGASALIVARGGKIMAEGTAAAPIIFTALADDTDDATDLQPTQNGLWGGVVLLGNARINGPEADGQNVSAIEGIPTTEERGLYGGNDDTDNSGIMTYVSIRHGGTEIGAGNEINGLSMGGVGNGTTLEHIEIFANFDDGVEFFGGSVGIKWLSIAYCGDDAIDWDQGFNGWVQYGLIIQSDNVGGRGGELNGVINGASWDYNSTPVALPNLANITSVGNNNADGNGDAALNRHRQGSGGSFYNSIFWNWGRGLRIDEVDGDEPVEAETRLHAGELVYDGNVFGAIFDRNTDAVGTDLSAVASGNSANADTVLHYLANVYSNIYTASAPLTSADRVSGFDPTPAGDAASATAATVPSGLTQETFIGGFGANNWLSGWTAIEEYGVAAQF